MMFKTYHMEIVHQPGSSIVKIRYTVHMYGGWGIVGSLQMGTMKGSAHSATKLLSLKHSEQVGHDPGCLGRGTQSLAPAGPGKQS